LRNTFFLTEERLELDRLRETCFFVLALFEGLAFNVRDLPFDAVVFFLLDGIYWQENRFKCRNYTVFCRLYSFNYSQKNRINRQERFIMQALKG